MKKDNNNIILRTFDKTTFCNYNQSVEWDTLKSQANLKKHGLDFNCANEILDGFYLVKQDTRRD